MKPIENILRVFVLISQKNGHYFFGQAVDFRRMLAAYNFGKSDFTKKNAPLAIFASKVAESRTEANRIELELRKKKSEDELFLYLMYNNFVIHDDRK